MYECLIFIKDFRLRVDLEDDVFETFEEAEAYGRGFVSLFSDEVRNTLEITFEVVS